MSEETVQTDSGNLGIAFQIALNVLRVHEPTNEAAERALRRLLESIHAAFLDDGECVMIATADQMFVNRKRLRQIEELTDLRRLLKRLHVGGIAFMSPPEPDALAVFVSKLARAGRWEAPDECYAQAISEDLIGEGGDLLESPPERVYRRAIGEIRSIFHDARHRGEINVRRARRLVGDVIETLVVQDSVVYGLMAMRDYDVYTFQHSVNVCILASTLGIRLGLDRVGARELGVAALFHDVGKLEIPRKILNKPARLTPQEWEVMKTHPVLGARRLLSQRGLEPSVLKAVRVALEHHLRFDGAGYPDLPQATGPGLFSQIVSMCDCYDAMTSIRVYRQTPVTPARAMSHIWSEAGKAYDPAVVKALLAMLGAYPPGSLVRLSDESLAVTVSGPRTPDVFRPVVKRWGETTPIDLSAMPGLTVTVCLDPAGADVSDDDVVEQLAVPASATK